MLIVVRARDMIARMEEDRLRKTIKIPPPVASIYRAVKELEVLYPSRRFTPDGHLVGSIGEVIAAEAFGLMLYPMSHAGHDGYDTNGDVQIKMTASKKVAMYANCDRLIVLRVVSPEEAEVIYDGPGEEVWSIASKAGKNGQRTVSIAKLKALTARVGEK